MTHYYYSPYNDEKMKQYASALVRAKSNNSIITSHRLTDDLSRVGHLDRLYVLIHGGERGQLGWKEYSQEAVEVTAFGVTKTMMQEKVDVHFLSPTELALEMINAGLTNKHIGLRLMACHGGQGYTCISATGKQLKYFLHHKGLTRISVYGYEGTVDVTPDQIRRDPHKKVNVTGDPGNLVRARNHRVMF